MIQPVQSPLRARLSRVGWLAALFFRLFPKRLSGRVRRRGLRLLHDVVDVLDAAGVHHQVDYGTLLGCFRDNDFIPWDEDLDFAVFAEDLPALRDACERARQRGLWVEEYYLPEDDVGGSGCRAGDPWMFRIEQRQSPVYPRDLYADIQVRRQRGDHAWWAILRQGVICLCQADAAMLEDGERRQFLGRTVTLPAQPEAYPGFLTRGLRWYLRGLVYSV